MYIYIKPMYTSAIDIIHIDCQFLSLFFFHAHFHKTKKAKPKRMNNPIFFSIYNQTITPVPGRTGRAVHK